MHRIIIVGSGVSATAAALEFANQGHKVRMLDVGMQAEAAPGTEQNFYNFAEKNDIFDLLIGKEFDGLANVYDAENAIPAKLVAPQFRFVTQDADHLAPISETSFSAIQSFARGGLANAWGAGLYEYNDQDLASFPISSRDLKPYYKKLTDEIGISGTNDDLEPFWGDAEDLQPPLRLSKNAQFLLKRYNRKRAALNRNGVYVGRPRLGVLSEDKRGRAACGYQNMEFWSPHLTSIYNPRFTLNRLVRDGMVDYKSGCLVKSWRRKGAVIEVVAFSIAEKEIVKFVCDTLVIAAGAINSAKIVLASKNDTRTKLSLMDNGAYQVPFFLLPRIGAGLETDAFGLTQLNIVFDGFEDDRRLQASILELTAPARAEFFSYFPLAARCSLNMVKYFLPAMMVMQLFMPEHERCADLSLTTDGTLKIDGREKPMENKLLRRIVGFLRQMGAVTHPSLIVDVKYGHSIHYAGTLPMNANPQTPYQCDAMGQLYGEPNVFVVDGAIFPALPAKNYSFTMMANAMRISHHIAATIRS